MAIHKQTEFSRLFMKTRSDHEIHLHKRDTTGHNMDETLRDVVSPAVYILCREHDLSALIA